MSALTGSSPKDTYKDLLQVSNSNAGIDATARNVEDGEGTASGLQLSSSEVKIPAGKTLNIDGVFDFAGASSFVGSLPEANGGTGQGSFASALAAANMVVGTNVQAFSENLAALASLSLAADKLPYSTSASAMALADFPSYGRSIVAQATAASARAILELVVGTNVQAYDAELAALAGLTSAADRLPYFTGSGTASLATFTSAARNLLDDASAGAMLTTLGVIPSSDIAAGIIERAVQSEMETATAVDRAVVPGRVQYHPGVAKGWVNIDGTGTAAVTVSHNVTSITDNNTGDYTITWATDFSSGNYCVAGMARNVASNEDVIVSVKNGTTPAAGSINIITGNGSGTPEDAEYICVVAFGDQA